MAKKQKDFTPIILLVAILVIAAIAVFLRTPSTTYYDTQVKGVLAAKNDDSSENRGGPDKSESNSNSGSNGNSGKSQDEDDSSDSSEEVKIKHEVRTNDERVKTEVRQDKTRIDLSTGGTETRIQEKDGELLIKTEIESKDRKEAANESEVIQELRAISKFPLRIDTTTNQLIMTKDGVERVLTVLPAKAVQNMLNAHLKKGLGPKFFSQPSPQATPVATPPAFPSAEPTIEPTPTESASPSASQEPTTASSEITVQESEITLGEENGEIVYIIPATKELNVLGFIPVTTEITGYVSAESGELIKEEEPLYSRILDILSP